MKRLAIYRPVFTKSERRAMQSPGGYASRMVEHLQDMEDWQRTMHEVADEGWGVCQMWVMEHRDGRVARLPEQCPWEELKRRSEARQRAWESYWKRRAEKIDAENCGQLRITMTIKNI